MITEFTCGIYRADYIEGKWLLTVNQYPIADVDNNGQCIKFSKEFTPIFTGECLIEIAVLMNKIKRQYKQLQTHS